jgi:hypothetical protein
MTGARSGGTESHRPYCETSGKHSYHGRKQAEGALNRVISEGGHPKRVYKCRLTADSGTSRARSSERHEALGRAP